MSKMNPSIPVHFSGMNRRQFLTLAGGALGSVVLSSPKPVRGQNIEIGGRPPVTYPDRLIPAEVTAQTQWPKNVQVISVASQQSKGWNFTIPFKEGVKVDKSLYLTALQGVIPKVDSLSGAIDLIQKTGYPSGPKKHLYFPTRSKNELTASWLKIPPSNTERFVCALGSYDNEKVSYKLGIEGVKHFFKANFGLKQGHILTKLVKTPTQVDESLDWLAKKAQKAIQAGKRPELLIYYNGHGTIQESLEALDKRSQSGLKEGEAQGQLALPSGDAAQTWQFYREPDFINAIKTRFPEPCQVTMIFDCCYSGSWVAKNQPESPKQWQA